jgi:hypothetical protein
MFICGYNERRCQVRTLDLRLRRISPTKTFRKSRNRETIDLLLTKSDHAHHRWPSNVDVNNRRSKAKEETKMKDCSNFISSSPW